MRNKRIERENPIPSGVLSSFIRVHEKHTRRERERERARESIPSVLSSFIRVNETHTHRERVKEAPSILFVIHVQQHPTKKG